MNIEGNEMKKILEVFGEPISNGGQESFVFNVLDHMEFTDMKVDVMTPYYCENEYYRKMIESKNGKIVALGLPFSPGKNRFNIIKPLDEYLNDNKYDVLHIHSGSISILAEISLVAHKHHIKKILVHSHCAAEHKTIRYRIVKLLSIPILNNYPTDYLACSKIAGEYKYSKKIVKNKLIILKNGVDLKKFEFDQFQRKKLRKMFDIADDTFVIGHVGRFSYQKNHEYIVEIFEKLKREHENSILILIGNGENLEKIKELVRLKNLVDSVRFIGNVNNVHEYLQVMDVFVLPSRFEGLPIVGVEAQANGLPVLVSTNVSSELKLSDAVEFISLDDQEKWVQKLLSYINFGRYDTRKSLTHNGYNIESTVQKIKKLYGN